MKNINLNIAGAVVHYDEFIKKLPILSLKNKNIHFTAYEGPNRCKWNGGRINRGITLTPEIIQRYNKFGVSLSLTFTNPTIDLSDEVGLDLLEQLHISGKKYNIKNKIVLLNEDLRKFLRENYDFTLIYSITGHPSNIVLSENTLKYYKELETKYDYIVPKFEHVFQKKFYEAVDTSKYELLINDTCKYACPYYKEHFEKIALQNSLSENPWSEFGHDACKKVEECWLPLEKFNPWDGSKKDRETHGENLGMNYTTEMIKKALKLGYSCFKLSGRENPTDFILFEIEKFCNDINGKG
jgi:hypothetical protein